MTTVEDGAFLADDTMVGSYELGGGWLRVGAAKVGKRAFLGNSGHDRARPRGARSAAWSACCRRRPKRRQGGLVLAGHAADASCPAPPRTATAAAPSTRRRGWCWPGRWSSCAGSCPVMCARRAGRAGPGRVRRRSTGAAGSAWRPRCRRAGAARRRRLVAGAGRRRGEVAAGRPVPGASSTRCGARSSGATSWPTRSSRCSPRRGSPARSTGTPMLNRVAARARRPDRPRRLVRDLLAARGRPGRARRRRDASTGAACCRPTCSMIESCSMDAVTLGAGATLGPHGIVLPGARIGAGATVGPASLVMRGEAVPADTRGSATRSPPWAASAGDGGTIGAGPLRRLVPARARQRRLPGRALRPGTGLPGRHRPARPAGRGLAAAARAAGRGSAWTSASFRVEPGLGGRPAGAVQPTAAASCAITAGPADAGRAPRSPSRSATSGNAEAGAQPALGRARLGAADRRRAGGQPAERRAVLVPVQRPARRQGHLPDRGDHRRRRTRWWPTAGWSRAIAAASTHDLGVRADRADGDLPGHRPDRPVRDGRLASAGGAAGRRARRGCVALFGTTSAGSRRSWPPSSELFGPYPFAEYARRGHRRRAGDPGRGAGPVDLRRATTWTGGAATSGWSRTSWPTSGSATA